MVATGNIISHETYQYATLEAVPGRTTNNVDPRNQGFITPCTCDLTPNGCDHACCCDQSCAPSAIREWRLIPGFCLDEVYDQATLSVEDCVARNTKPVLQDLQGQSIGIEKVSRSLLCTSQQRDPSSTETFIDEMLSAETVESFDELSAKAESESDVYTLTKPAVDTSSF